MNVILETLRLVVEHVVSRFPLLTENGGQHIEHVLHQSHEIKKNNLLDVFHAVLSSE